VEQGFAVARFTLRLPSATCAAARAIGGVFETSLNEVICEATRRYIAELVERDPRIAERIKQSVASQLKKDERRALDRGKS
jgi:hypothetical protein